MDEITTTPPGQKLKSILDLTGNTQVWAAKRLQISPQYLNDILAGRKTPTGAVATRIQESFGLPLQAWYQQEVAS